MPNKNGFVGALFGKVPQQNRKSAPTKSVLLGHFPEHASTKVPQQKCPTKVPNKTVFVRDLLGTCWAITFLLGTRLVLLVTQRFAPFMDVFEKQNSKLKL